MYVALSSILHEVFLTYPTQEDERLRWLQGKLRASVRPTLLNPPDMVRGLKGRFSVTALNPRIWSFTLCEYKLAPYLTEQQRKNKVCYYLRQGIVSTKLCATWFFLITWDLKEKMPREVTIYLSSNIFICETNSSDD